VICAWGIYAAVSEVGRVCHPGEDPAIQAEFARSVERIDSYVARNSPEMTPSRIAEFKRTQAKVGTPAASLCTNSTLTELYRRMSRTDPAALKTDVDKMLSRDGKPTWGDCL